MQATETDWEAEVIRLKAEDAERTSADIADLVGKHAGTVRKVLKRHREEIERVGALNGHGTPEQREAIEMGMALGGVIPGQTTVDDFTVPAEDDPEHPDTLADFRAEAGEPVGPMVPLALPEPEAFEVRLKGTRQMALDFGENANLPTGATVVLKSDKLASGFFGLGDEFSGTFRARITKAPGEEGFDKDFEEWRTKDTAYGATILEVTFD